MNGDRGGPCNREQSEREKEREKKKDKKKFILSFITRIKGVKIFFLLREQSPDMKCNLRDGFI